MEAPSSLTLSTHFSDFGNFRITVHPSSHFVSVIVANTAIEFQIDTFDASSPLIEAIERILAFFSASGA
jgi:hypothetical protein